jgi:menaquinol-cytochrome c reductase cytochrome b/c subunit
MSEPPNPKFAAQFDSDARRTPVRVAFVTRRTSPQVKAQDDSVVMTYPEALLRAAVAIEILAIALVIVSLIWDAPLEQLADPMHTPNPAKAPWYFLGLQELLQYFPKFVAGVLIPTMVVLALIVIPYFDINIESEGVWLRNRERRLRIFIGVLVAFTAVMLVFHVYAVLIPTLAIAAFMLAAAAGAPEHSGFRRWLVSKPLSFWIMTWFLVQAGILTAIGTFFRGAGWSWVWPWRS